MSQQAERPRWRGKLARAVAATLGAGVLYHEIWVAETAEPLLLFLGLWLMGVPPAMFFDSVRNAVKDAEELTDRAPDEDSRNGDGA